MTLCVSVRSRNFFQVKEVDGPQGSFGVQFTCLSEAMLMASFFFAVYSGKRLAG